MQGDLFGKTPIQIPSSSQWNLNQQLLEEMETLDICVSAHPLKLFGIDFNGRKYLDFNGYRLTAGTGLNGRVGRYVTVAGWVVSSSRTKTKHGDWMKFLTLDDSTGLFEVTIWPKTYKRFGDILRSDRGPFIIKGLVTKQFDTSPPVVEAMWIQLLRLS